MYVGNKKDKEKRKYVFAPLFYFFFLVELGAKEYVLQSDLKMCMYFALKTGFN